MNKRGNRYSLDGVRPVRPGVWEIRISLGADPVKKDAQGNPVYRRKSFTFKGTKTEARAYRQRLIDRLVPTAMVRTDYTFGDLFEQWMDAATDLSPATRQAHTMLANKHILPSLGGIRLRDLRTQQLEQLYADLHRPKAKKGAGLHPSSIRRVHAILNTALKRGMAWEWIERNPAEFAKPPRVHGRANTYTPTVLELQRALLAAADIGPWAAVFVATAAATGMRRSELCGLQWNDVDGIAAVIHVRRAIVDVGGSPVVKSPKTGKGRIVEIPAFLVTTLAAYQETLIDPGPWIWSASSRGFVHPSKLTDTWNTIKERAGIPKQCRLHDLRHAFGSNILEEGGEGMLAAVAALLGHGDMTTTMRYYLSSSTTGRRAAADTIGRLLSEQAAGLPDGYQASLPPVEPTTGPNGLTDALLVLMTGHEVSVGEAFAQLEPRFPSTTYSSVASQVRRLLVDGRLRRVSRGTYTATRKPSPTSWVTVT